jgi:hypothetical protein
MSRAGFLVRSSSEKAMVTRIRENLLTGCEKHSPATHWFKLERINKKALHDSCDSFCRCGRLPRLDLYYALRLNFLRTSRRPEPFAKCLETHVKRRDDENSDE